MARKNRLFVSASGLTLALATTPTHAQSVSAPADQGAPTTQAESSEAVDVGDGDVVVRGIRRSLQKAAEIKKNADEIVDSVVAEDIGKFPDNNAIETVARIPGVQIGRRNDEGFETLVRGLGLITTTLNGRESFIVDSRAFALQEFASDSLAGVDVFKANTATNVEAGIGGLINVRLRRPFDLPTGVTVAGNARAQYYDLTKKTNALGSLLYSVRKDTGIGELGLLVNVAYFSASYNQSVRYAGAPGTNQTGQVITPAGGPAVFNLPIEDVGLFFGQGFRARYSANLAAQWAPDADTMFYLEGFYQGLDAEIRDAQVAYRTRNVNNLPLPIRNAVFITPTLEDGSTPRTLNNVIGGTPLQILNSGTIDYTPASGNGPGPFYNGRNIWLNTVQAALGGTKRTGRAKLSFDVAYTNSVQLDDRKNIDVFINKPFTFNFVYNNAGNQGASFDTPGFDPSDPSNYSLRGFVQEYIRTIGDQWQGRFDGVLDTDNSFFTEFDFGGRAVTRTVKQYAGRRDLNVRAGNIPITSLPGYEAYDYKTNFRGGFLSNYPGLAGINMNDFRSNFYDQILPYLRSLPATTATDAGQRALYAVGDNPVRDISRNFDASEQTYAGYAQVKFRLEPGFPIDGIIGARIVNTVGKVTAYGRNVVTVNNPVPPGGTTTTTTPVLRNSKYNYVDFMPNASIRARFTDKLQMRLSYSESLIRPTLNNGTIGPGAIVTTNAAGTTTVSRGNPDLKPQRSDNYDATLEYYFGRAQYITLAIFQKNLTGLIFTQNDPAAPGGEFGINGTVQLSQPRNAGNGKIKGVEAAFSTTFTFLPSPLDGFGVTANVTYLDGKQRLPVGGTVGAALSPLLPIQNVSKWTYNASLFYEKGPVSARVSYNRRSKFVNSFNNTGALPFYPERVTAISRLDASASFQITKEIAITADAANLLGKPFKNYIDDPAYPRDYRYESKVYSVGARFRF